MNVDPYELTQKMKYFSSNPPEFEGSGVEPMTHDHWDNSLDAFVNYE